MLKNVQTLLSCLTIALISTNVNAQSSYFIDQISSNDTVGVLYDQGGASGPYSDNANAVFTITPSNGKEVKIQFRDFDIEAGETQLLPEQFRLCEYDNVTIFDGADTTGTNLGVFCGTTLPPNFESTTGSLTIQLKSDGGTNGRGFDIYWTTDTLPTTVGSLYCAASGVNCDANDPATYDRYISHVSLTNVSNSSICSPNGYTDYSNLVAAIPAGDQAQLTVTTVFSNYVSFVYGWIDYNDDKEFSTDEAIAIAGNGFLNTHTAVITAPVGVEGLRRMRLRYDVVESPGVVALTNGNNSPCGASDFGEVEDYTVFFGDTVIVGSGPTYCNASARNDCRFLFDTDTIDDHINYVRFTSDVGFIDNITMCDNGYGDYSDIVVPVSTSDVYEIVLNRSEANDLAFAGGWIDWNNNKQFEQTEYYDAINILGDYTINYTVSPTQADGLYRVRLRLSGNQPPTNPCGTNNYEVEDYSILIGTPLACITNPMPMDGVTDVCTSNTTLIWDSVPGATNYRFSLSYNAGAGDVTVVQDLALSDTTYTVPSLVNNATYKWIAVPYNQSMEALNCDTLSFTTAAFVNPVVDIAEDTIQLCAGTSYSIEAAAVEGNGPLRFSWTGDVSDLDRTDSSVVVFRSVAEGEYKLYVSVNDDINCPSNIDSVLVQVQAGAVKGTLAIADTNACFGSPILAQWNMFFGTETIEVSTDNVNFTIADSVVTNGSEYSIYLDPGVYYIRGAVDAGSGCVDSTSSIAVLVRGAMDMPIISFLGNSLICSDDSSKVQIENYTSGIVWNDNASFTTNPLSIEKAGDYYATITDATTGCSVDSDTLTLLVHPIMQPALISFVGSGTICEGESELIQIDNYTSGIVWNNNSALSDNPLTISASGEYFATVSDANGCDVQSDTLTLVVHPALEPAVISFVGTGIICEGESDKVQIENYTSGIVWNNNPATTNNPLEVTLAGNYFATITDAATGCSIESDIVTLVVNSKPNAPVISCDGENIVSDATASAYQWFKNDVLISGQSGVSIPYDREAGAEYYAVAQSAASCGSEASNKIVLPGIATIIYDNVNLTASEVADAYQWYYNGVAVVGATGKTFAHNKVEGDYTVELINGEGCFSPLSEVFNLSTVGVLEANVLSLNIYPNPSKGNVTVSVKGSNGNIALSMMDVSGKIIYTSEIQNDVPVTINNLNAGIYIIQTVDAKGVQSKKLIVE